MSTKPEVEDLIRQLRGVSDKNSFANSLVQFYDKSGFLTPKQIFAGKRLALTSIPGAGHGFSWSILVDGVYIDSDSESKFVQLYKVAHVKQKRVIRRRGIDIPAWSSVKDNGFAHQRILKLLGESYIRLLSFDEMVEIGRRPGRCCICGRALDDEKSVAAGIGPICAKNLKGSQ